MNRFLLRGGTVFDGSSPRGRREDVLIDSGRIAAIGSGIDATGATTLDVDGCWVSPGFVDAHSHADSAAVLGQAMELRALGGVTTEVVGQDGLGLSYLNRRSAEPMREILFPIAGELPRADFADVAGYLAWVDQAAYSRVATLIPHGTVRAAVLGRSLTPASSSARATMNTLIRQGMAQGACGISTGLSYPPAHAADVDELAEVFGGLPSGTPYVTHLRSYGDGLDEGIDEAIEITRRSGLDLHLTHFHLSGPGREGTAAGYLEMLAASAPEATWDSYPYLSGCTFLTALVPIWIQELPGTDIPAVLAERGSEVARQLDAEGPGPTVAVDWDVLLIAGLTGTRLAAWELRPLGTLAAEQGLSCGEVVTEVLSATGGRACVLVPQGHLDNVRAIAQGRGHMVGSDGIFGSGAPHPRIANTFFRFLSWAKDGLLELFPGQLIQRMTSRTAARYGLPVGVLAPGAPADVLVIDPDRLDAGDEHTVRPSQALQYSFLGGERCVWDGRWTAPRLPGLALRKENPR